MTHAKHKCQQCGKLYNHVIVIKGMMICGQCKLKTHRIPRTKIPEEILKESYVVHRSSRHGIVTLPEFLIGKIVKIVPVDNPESPDALSKIFDDVKGGEENGRE